MVDLNLERYRKDKEGWVNSPEYELIIKEIGVPLRRPSGFWMLLKIHGYQEKTKGGLYITETTRENDLWNNRIGKVLAMGPDCYQGERFASGAYCEVGEWVHFRRHEAILGKVNKCNIAWLMDDKVVSPLEDPDIFMSGLHSGS